MSQEHIQPPTVPTEVQTEEVIDGFTSSYLQRDTYRPYGIYITTKRIIGFKPSRLQKINPMWIFAIVLGIVLVGTLFGFGRFIVRRTIYKPDDFSKKTIEELEGKKDFEVFKDDIQEIRMQEPKGSFMSLFGGGFGGFGRSRRRSRRQFRDLIIQSNEHEYRINVFKGDTFQKLYDMFNEPETIEDMFEPNRIDDMPNKPAIA